MAASSDTQVRGTRKLEASPDRVFDCWIDPKLLRRWWIGSPQSEVREVINDPRVGGGFSILESSPSGTIERRGYYREMERPNLLEFTFDVAPTSADPTLVRIEILPASSGCTLHLAHTGEGVDVVDPPWQAMLERLARVAADD